MHPNAAVQQKPELRLTGARLVTVGLPRWRSDAALHKAPKSYSRDLSSVATVVVLSLHLIGPARAVFHYGSLLSLC